MPFNMDFCELIRSIKEDPFRQIKGMTVDYFQCLQEHIESCEECNLIVTEINNRYKDIPDDPNSEWNKAKYN